MVKNGPFWTSFGLFGSVWHLLSLFPPCLIHVIYLSTSWSHFSLFWPTMLLKCSISTSKKEITLPSEIWWSSSRNQEMKIGKKWQHHSDHPKRHELNVNVTSSKILQFFKNMSKHYESMNFLFRFY